MSASSFNQSSSCVFFRFEILHRSTRSQARVGRIHTPHGVIDTPHFVAVGTNGTLKALSNDLLDQAGLQLMFCNTYHLLIHPGSAVIKKAGGLHRFINRRQPLITDSGGFQVFSLSYGSVHEELKSRGSKKRGSSLIQISEEGVLFRSYRDGSPIWLTPESSIQAQKDLGADMIIPLDELPPYHISAEALKASLERTHRWEKRSLEEHLKNPNQQALYGVIHGGIDPELRHISCRYLTQLPFDGFAIGGSVGKDRKELREVVACTRPQIPAEYPLHLLGIGDLPSLEEIIPLGIDTFDSSYPTRAARHGLLLTDIGGIKIEQAKYKDCFEPIDKRCDCPTCSQFSLSYLHHLFKAKEVTALTLASLHNIHFMIRWMSNLRAQIYANHI